MIRKVVETRFIWNDNNIMTEKQMKRIVVLGLLALGLLGMTHANAGLLRLDATSTEPDNRSDFFVTFDDGGDGQLQAEEIISFSGLTLFADATVYDVLLGVPTIPSISTISGFCPIAERWCFLAPDFGVLVAVSQDSFTYAIGRAVPEPGTVVLLSLGLIALALTRRRSAQEGVLPHLVLQVRASANLCRASVQTRSGEFCPRRVPG